MLPDRLVPFREHEGVVVPRWLEARDEVWLRAIVQDLEACEGLTVAEVDERIIDASFRLARLHGVERRVVEAVWHLERRRHETHVDSPVPPERVREVVFELAAERDHDEAVVTAALMLEIEPALVPRVLFADRAGARRMTLARTPATPRTLLEQYNRALAESLVVRTTEVVAHVRAHLRRVVGVARLRGLMLRAEETREGTKLVVSGPLALFHATVKYGRALASWLHTLATTPAWSLEGRARLGGQELLVRLDASAPIPRVRELSRATDSKVEARLVRDLRRHAPRVKLERESQVLRVGSHMCFPDFALTFDDATVLVEIVGFWTPEYLAAKAELAAKADRPLVVCVDARHATGALAPRAGVIPFTGHIDVRSLLEACDLVRATWSRKAASASPPPCVGPEGTPRNEPILLHVLRFSPTAQFARHAVAAGGSPERWAEEIAADIARGSCLHATLLDVDPVYGPQMLLVGDRFLIRAGRDRLRADALFVNAVWARLPGRPVPATSALPVKLVHPSSDEAAAAAVHDVALLVARLSSLATAVG
jgi:predicted nuclease of restriction endonuclease-like RecB superfamily